MFVRWKRRERVGVKRDRKRGPYWSIPPRPPSIRKTGRFLLSAVLVRSERRDGKPRQRIVAYLGCIEEDPGQGGIWPRIRFWKDVVPRLDALALDSDTRARVERALLARVPRPTPEEEAAAWRENAAWLQSLAAKLRAT